MERLYDCKKLHEDLRSLACPTPPEIPEQPRVEVFSQMNRKGRWACGPCLNLVNKFRCDAHVRDTLRLESRKANTAGI